MNKKIISPIFSFIKDKKNRNLILGICAAAALFIAIPLFETKPAAKAAAEAPQVISPQEYSDILTEKLEQIISQMDGVGKVQILLTMVNGVENIYVDEEKTSQTGENLGIARKEDPLGPVTSLQRERQVLVIRDNDGGENPVLVTQLEPKVSGVLVVCDGGNRETVVYQVTNAIKALLDVPTNRIHVMKRKT